MDTFKERLDRLEGLISALSPEQQMEQIAEWHEQLKDMVLVRRQDLKTILAAIKWVSHEATRQAYNRLVAGEKQQGVADHGASISEELLRATPADCKIVPAEEI